MRKEEWKGRTEKEARNIRREGGRELEREISNGEFNAPLLYLKEVEMDKILHKMGMISVVEDSGRNGGYTL